MRQDVATYPLKAVPSDVLASGCVKTSAHLCRAETRGAATGKVEGTILWARPRHLQASEPIDALVSGWHNSPVHVYIIDALRPNPHGRAVVASTLSAILESRQRQRSRGNEGGHAAYASEKHISHPFRPEAIHSFPGKQRSPNSAYTSGSRMGS